GTETSLVRKRTTRSQESARLHGLQPFPAALDSHAIPMPNGTPTQAPPSEAVPTSNAAFVGATGGGPDGQAVLVTSFSEYLLRFRTRGNAPRPGLPLLLAHGAQGAQ